MVQAAELKVPFTPENISSCLCPKCPVQSDSGCVKRKVKGIEKALKKNPIKPEDIPGVYCATGKCSCGDVDFAQACRCSGCAVFSKYKLSTATPNAYFCEKGSCMARWPATAQEGQAYMPPQIL